MKETAVPTYPVPRKLRNFLINREYQFHYAGQMALVSGLLTGALGLMMWLFQAEASRVVNLRALDPGDEAAKAVKEAMARSSSHLLIGLLVFGLLLMGVLVVWQIFTTHRVAGPLYYIAQQARRIRDGYLGKIHGLRKRDMLHQFFETFREMHDALRDRARRDVETLERIAATVEKAGQLEAAAELRKMKQEREEALQ
jgi:methyl-accepting chemotaxis protein